MVNRYKAYWSSMSTGKYDFEPEKLDKNIEEKLERKKRKKDTIQAMVEGMMNGDPIHQDETFSMFCEVLRDWRKENERN